MNELMFKGTQEFMDNQIPVVYGGFGENQKCISDKTIAELHGINTFKVRERISNNINRFKENVDFIDLSQRILLTDTLELLKNIGYAKQSITQAEHIYILSKRGYAKLIKIFDTDLSWEVYEKLLDEYFYLEEEQISIKQLSPELQMFKQIFDVVSKQELKINQLEEKTDRVAETIQTVTYTFVKAGEAENFNKLVNSSMDMIANSDKFIAIGYMRYQTVKAESYKRLQDIAHCDLKTLVKNAKARAKKAGATITQQNTINTLFIISNDKRLKAIYATIVKEMLLAYCVEVGVLV